MWLLDCDTFGEVVTLRLIEEQIMIKGPKIVSAGVRGSQNSYKYYLL